MFVIHRNDGTKRGGKGIEFSGELGEDGGTVEEAGGGVTGIVGKQGRSEGGVGGESGGEAGVDEGGEHLLVAEVRTEMFVGGRVRVAGSTDERQAVCCGLGGKVRILEQQFGIERGGSHLLAMERLGVRPVVGFVLVAISGLVDAEEFALGDVRLLAEDLAGGGLNGVLIRYLGHSCWG